MIPSPPSVTISDDVLQHPALQNRLGGQHLQDWAWNYTAIRHIEPVAELDRRCADNDFLVLELFQGSWIAAQNIHIGNVGRESASMLKSI